MVEVMVAAAVLGAVALLGMKLTENMKSVENRGAGVMDAREALSEVRAILDNEKHCKVSFQKADGSPLQFRKTEIDEPGKDPGLPVELWFGNADGTARTQKKFFDGAELGRTKILSVRLFMNNGKGQEYGDGAKSDLGLVRLSYAFSGQGTKTLQRDFLINLDFKTASGTSTILSCERSGIKAMCESLNMNYNPETQKCLNPPEECDPWKEVGEMGFSGWKEGACSRLDGGYVQSMSVSQSRTGNTDSNGFKIKCCYSRKYEMAYCAPPKEVADTSWWTGNKEGACTDRPRGFLRRVDFYQGNAGGKDTNGMKITCCYPN